MGTSLDLAAFFFGAFVPVFIFAFAKAARQTQSIWTHRRTFINTYIFLVWGEAVCNLVFAVTTILFLVDVIPPTDAYFGAACTLWAIQVELLPQIIANRVALIMVDQRKAKMLKWGLAALITPVCIAVLYIWTAAHVESATPEQIELNRVFELCEKAFFLVVDLSLNLYFLYLVRFRLIACGLTKYWTLFNFNVGMVIISTAFDIMLLGFLELPDPYVYVQFAPLAYISKLWIELQMANLIFKVVKSRTDPTGRDPEAGWYSKSVEKSQNKSMNGSRIGDTLMSKLGKESGHEREGSGSEVELTNYNGGNSITKTIETSVVVSDQDEGKPSINNRAW